MRWSHGHVAMACICVAAVGLLGAACGKDDGAAVADPSASAPVPSASTDTAENDKAISEEAAAEQYMALVAAPNCAIDKLNAAIKDVATTPSGAVAEDQWPAIEATVVPALVEVRVTGRDWAAVLLKAEWPPPVASDVEELALADTTSTISTARSQARRTSTPSSSSTTPRTPPPFRRERSGGETVREDLGLKLGDDRPAGLGRALAGRRRSQEVRPATQGPRTRAVIRRQQSRRASRYSVAPRCAQRGGALLARSPSQRPRKDLNLPTAD